MFIQKYTCVLYFDARFYKVIDCCLTPSEQFHRKKNNSPRVDISPHSVPSQPVVLLNAVCLVKV